MSNNSLACFLCTATFVLKNTRSLSTLETLRHHGTWKLLKPKLLDSLTPTQWQFTQSGLTPVEFMYGMKDNSNALKLQSSENFISELHGFLERHQLLGHFGLQVLEPDDLLLEDISQ
jgi:hypothetical protein